MSFRLKLIIRIISEISGENQKHKKSSAFLCSFAFFARNDSLGCQIVGYLVKNHAC